MGDSRYKDVSRLLEAFFDKETLRAGGRYVEFLGSWRKIAGEQLASHSKPVDVRNGMLIVGAEHSSWIQLLQLKQESILAKVQANFPELDVRAMGYRLVDDLAAEAEIATAHPMKPPENPPAPNESPERTENLAIGIAEAGLPEALKGVFGRLKGRLEP